MPGRSSAFDPQFDDNEQVNIAEQAKTEKEIMTQLGLKEEKHKHDLTEIGIH